MLTDSEYLEIDVARVMMLVVNGLIVLWGVVNFSGPVILWGETRWLRNYLAKRQSRGSVRDPAF